MGILCKSTTNQSLKNLVKDNTLQPNSLDVPKVKSLQLKYLKKQDINLRKTN